MVNFNDTKINSPVRQIKSKVELLNGSTLLYTFTNIDKLKSFTIERVGDNTKFFGFTVCQKLNLKIIDTKREIAVSAGNSIRVGLTADTEYCNPFPLFYVTETHRDAITGELSITAYDALYKAASTPLVALTEAGLAAPYTVRDVITCCANILNLEVDYRNLTYTELLDLTYNEGANFSGNETIRDVLTYICELTTSVCFLTESKLTFVILTDKLEPVAAINKDNYFDLKELTTRRLSNIVSVTELGDNFTVSTGKSGSTQFIRVNPFLDLREDRTTILENNLAIVGDLRIAQFTCDWRGDYRLEIGDRISFGNSLSFLFNDVISYDGSLQQKSEWNYEDNPEETASNPTNIGANIKQTTARVDKVNKQITLVVSDSDANKDRISSLEQNQNSISASVQDLNKKVDTNSEGTSQAIEDISKAVNTKMDAAGVEIKVQEMISQGAVNEVTTETGFTFNKDGLTVQKDKSDIKTLIDNDGMKISNKGTTVLTANNQGVDALNLHATTYLIVGLNSRFEDYDGGTGCFFVGN